MNTNCLAGLRCPNCGSEGPFRIRAVASFLLHDDGADEFWEMDWDGNSWCQCANCNHGHETTVDDFMIEEGNDER